MLASLSKCLKWFFISSACADNVTYFMRKIVPVIVVFILYSLCVQAKVGHEIRGGFSGKIIDSKKALRTLENLIRISNQEEVLA